MANYVTLWFILFKSLFFSFLYYLIVFVVAMKKRVGRHAPRTSYISLNFSRHSVTNHSNTNRNIFRLFRTIYKVSFSDRFKNDGNVQLYQTFCNLVVPITCFWHINPSKLAHGHQHFKDTGCNE